MATLPEKAESLQSAAANHVTCAAAILEVLLAEAYTRRDRINEKWIATLLTDARQIERSLQLLAGQGMRV